MHGRGTHAGCHDQHVAGVNRKWFGSIHHHRKMDPNQLRLSCLLEPQQWHHLSWQSPGTQCHAKGFCWRSKSLAELGRVIILKLIPRNELSPLDPAIVTREFAAKRQEKVFERELMTILTLVHVENSGPLLGSNRPIGAHFTAKNYWDPLRCNRSALIRKAPNRP